ncbi:MAG: N-acyl homoserine lactonase family protein [Pseudomonadota bacterium]
MLAVQKKTDILRGLVVSASAAALSLALAACGSEPETGAGDEPRSAAVEAEAASLKLYAMECGLIAISDLKDFSDDGSYDGKSDVYADGCFLVRHPDGDLLWDLGLPDNLAGADEPMVLDVYTITMPRTLKSQLAEIDVAPADIEFVALSHTHFDHVGNAADYVGATWIVNPAERVFAFDAERRAEPELAMTAPLAEYDVMEITEDHDVFGDGSVMLLQTPGHTPGHLALMVTLKNTGPVLLTGDLYHRKQSREERLVPRFNTDRAATLASMDKFEEIAKEAGARVILQHSQEDMASLPKVPAYLD